MRLPAPCKSTILVLVGIVISLTFMSRTASAVRVIDWNRSFTVAGIALGLPREMVLDSLGPPARISLSAPGTPGLPMGNVPLELDAPCWIWEYPNLRIKFWHDYVVGIAGQDLQQGHTVIHKGDKLDADLEILNYPAEKKPPVQISAYKVFQCIYHPRPGVGIPPEKPALLAIRVTSGRFDTFTLFLEDFSLPDLNSPRPLPPSNLQSFPNLGKKIRVGFRTTRGDFEIEVFPEANPESAQRFLARVRDGLYNDIPLDHVVPGFSVNFGVGNSAWRSRPTPPRRDYRLERGMIAHGVNDMTIINFQGLTAERPIWPPIIGRVSQGIEVLESLPYVGDPEYGLDKIWAPKAYQRYMTRPHPPPDKILSAKIYES